MIPDGDDGAAAPAGRSGLAHLRVAAWLDHPPESLVGAGIDPRAWPSAPVDPRGSAWLRSVFRFTRPDGSVVFDPRRRATARLAALEGYVRRVGDPALARVIGWWRPASAIGRLVAPAAPPPAAETWAVEALAVLRADWTARGDLLAVDHRAAGATSTIEVAGLGATWLGPNWSAPAFVGASAARPTFAASTPHADAFEWSFRAGDATINRSTVLIRGRGLALLLQDESGVDPGVGEARWALPEGVEARPDPVLRALILSAGRGKPSARLVPLGLPESDYPTDRGSLTVEGREVVLRQAGAGPNRCLALLVTWGGRPPASWRSLTVAEKSAACPPDAAFAARVGWGAGRDGLLVYRSLGPAALRSVLGHQTGARFLVAGFTPMGEVRPWIKALSGARKFAN